jgi:hypothetical protein
MNYEDIRKARLQTPFQPFILRMMNGEEHLIQDPTTLAISQRILAFVNPKTGIIEETSPRAAESITFVEQVKTTNA